MRSLSVSCLITMPWLLCVILALASVAASSSSSPTSHPASSTSSLSSVISSSPSAAASFTPSTSSAASASSSALPAVHSVTVGVGGFTYSPNSIQANVGDTILFEFTSGNHSVARAEYGYPCIPYEDTGSGKVGFWSGFKPAISSDLEDSPVYRLLVNSTDPVFFYCSAPGACVPHQMIGVINPNSTYTLASQAIFITASSIQYSPGESPPSESTASATPTPTPTSTPSPTSTPASGGSSGLSGGAIGGIVVGAVAAVALAGTVFYLYGRNRSLSDVLRYSSPPQPRPNAIPVLPAPPPTESIGGSPYSSNFSPKLVRPTTPAANTHDSWQAQQQHVTSTEMVEGRDLMPSGHMTLGYANGYGANNMANAQPPWSPGAFTAYTQYAAIPQNHEMSSDTMSSTGLGSPGFQSEAASLMGVSQRAPSEGMSLMGLSQQAPSEGMSLMGLSQQAPSEGASLIGLSQRVPNPTHSGPHELDAQPSVPESPTAAPPEYVQRSFSFAQGPDGAPGVEKEVRR